MRQVRNDDLYRAILIPSPLFVVASDVNLVFPVLSLCALAGYLRCTQCTAVSRVAFHRVRPSRHGADWRHQALPSKKYMITS